jgi:type IV pilus assembly protein PilA
MNMILKKRLANRGGRKGFTLVEVIVVLVILAILAAIAIPALTGYINKAHQTDIKSIMKTQLTAVQTMIIDEKQRDGGFIVHTYEHVTPGNSNYDPKLANAYFRNVGKPSAKAVSNGFNSDGRILNDFTPVGIAEYERLTGRPKGEDFAVNAKGCEVFVDSSGAIFQYRYSNYRYFGNFYETGEWLRVMYISDTNHPYNKKIVEDSQATSVPLKAGFNFLHVWEVRGASTEAKIELMP